MRNDIDDLAEETLFALEEEADRASGGSWGLTQAQGNLVAAHVALGNALTGRDVGRQIALARTFLRQAVQYQSGLSSSASRALAAIQRRDFDGALAIVRGMYPLVGGGAA
jgi:CTP:molybdopterin cytidylyltransferase MocA